MYDCKAPLSRFYYPDTRRIINAFIIIIIIIFGQTFNNCHRRWSNMYVNIDVWRYVFTKNQVALFGLQVRNMLFRIAT